MSVPAQQAAGAALDLRRVTVVAPHGRFDLAVPASVPLAYLVPTVLRQAGEQLADLGASRGGWVLQRLGGAPFDTAASPAALGIADGELLYLRLRRDEIPVPVFDDAADAIGTTLAERARPWDEPAGRAAGLAAAAAVLVAAAAAALLAGPPWAGRAAALGVSCLVLLLAGALASRSAGDGPAAAVLGCGAVGHGALAACLGILALPGAGAGPALSAGAAVGLLLCALGFVASGTGAAEFAGAAVVCLAGLAAGVALALDGTLGPAGASSGAAGGTATAPDAAAGAAALVVAFLVTPFIPTFAYRAARLPKPFLPTTAEELRAGEKSAPGEQVAARTLRADHYVTALMAACAAATIGAGWFLGAGPGWAPPALAGLGCALSALRTRTLRGRGQRLCLTASAIALGVETAAGLAGQQHGPVGGSVVVAAAALLAVPVAIGATRSGQTPSPPVARFLGIAEGLCAVAVIPVALQVFGVYAELRGLIG